MPTENELRALLRDGSGPAGRIDVGAVLYRARARRRRPRVALTAAISALVVIGITVPVTLTLAPLQFGGATAGSASRPLTGAGAPSAQSLDRTPAESINRCGAPVVQPPSADDGLTLTVATPPDAAAGDRDVPVQVTLTNTSSVVLTGSTAASPALTLARDGIVVWHSNGPMALIAARVELQPGQSISYHATLETAVCSAADESGDGFRPELPPAEPGAYQLSAAIVFLPDGDVAAPVLVGGPPTTMTLH